MVCWARFRFAVLGYDTLCSDQLWFVLVGE